MLIKPWNLLALVLSLTPAATAPAQTDAPSPAARLLAAQFEYMASPLLNFKTLTEQSQVDTARALIDQANALDPTSAHRWWAASELAALDQDAGAEKAALGRYLKLAPSDDFAQLRLIDLYLADRQTVDERIALCDRFVEGPRAKKFTAALRSRLATRAALMHREQGRPDEFKRLLALAIQLDPTNQEAAAESFRALAADPASTTPQKAAALFTLFNANPTDPTTHTGVGDTLMEFGLYAEAYDWFTSATALTRMRGRRTDLPLMHSAAMSMWGSGQVDQAMQLLNFIDPPDKPADAAAPQAPAANGPAPDGPAKDPNWPPVESLMLKAAFVATTANPQGLDELYQRIEKRLLSDRTGELGPQELSHLVWSRLMLDQSLDTTPQLIERLEKLNGPQPVLHGWLAARRGEADRARLLLGPLVDTDARAALGLTLGRKLDAADAEGVALLRKVAAAAPYDIFGLTAVARLRAAGVALALPDDARQLKRLFDNVPDDLQHAYAQRGQFTQLRLNTPKMRFELGEPIEVEIELRNVSDVPLSLGAGGSVGGEVMILPRLALPGVPQPMGAPPISVDLHRRITIAPRRAVTLPVRIDTASTDFGFVVRAMPQSRVQLDLVAILNPRFNNRGGVVPGLLGSSAQTRNLARRSTPISPEKIDAALANLNSPDAAASMRAMAYVIPILSKLATDEQQAEQVRRITDAVNAAYPGLDPLRQAWVLARVGMLQEFQERERFEPVYTAAAESDHEMVRLALLAFSQSITEADDPLLTAALRGDNEKLKRFAEAKRGLLELIKRQKAEAEAQQAAAEKAAAERGGGGPLPPLDLNLK